MRIGNCSQHNFRGCLTILTVVMGMVLRYAPVAYSQEITKFDRERGIAMLKNIKDDIKKNYYDERYHGIDVDARFKAAEEKMKEAQSIGKTFGIIAQALLDFNDSHMFFTPPRRSSRTDYGWQMMMVGDTCYVSAVKPGSDAKTKGLKVGDAVLSIGGYAPTRQDLWKLRYLYYQLRPQPGLHLVVQSPGSPPRELDVMAKIKQGKRVTDLTGSDGGGGIWDLIRDMESEDRLNRHRYVEMEGDLLIWKMPHFDLDEHEVDRQMSRVRKHKALILDLRGNPGGSVITLQRLAGHFFDHDVKIADLKGRKAMKPQMAKTRGKNGFDGKLILLVDHRSASASEVFARLMQIEKRGTVIGDRTAGAVMQARYFSHELGSDTVVLYGASITNADLIMTDGKSLEHVGVTPDELLLPTAEDLANERDPVLAHAAELAGVKLSSEKAGKLFPIEWQK